MDITGIMHYNNPNAFDTSGYKNKTQYTEGKTAAGTDYYYTYGNTLFIILDTNNYNCATHENVMRKAIKENPNAKLDLMQLDLADFYSIRNFSNEFHSKYSKLDVLVNNTGVMNPPKREVTKQHF